MSNQGYTEPNDGYATGSTTATATQTVDRSHDSRDARHRDRMPWGAISAGAVVALASYLVIILLLATADVMPIDAGGSDDDGHIQAAVAGLVAFFLGGLTLGAAARHRTADDGLFQGIVMWAFASTILVLLAVFGLVLARDSFDQNVGDLSASQRVGGASEQEGAEEQDEAGEESAGGAALFLGLSFVGAVVGASAGTKMWPKDDEYEVRSAAARR